MDENRTEPFIVTLPMPPTNNHAQGMTARGGRPRIYTTKATDEWANRCEEILQYFSGGRFQTGTRVSIFVIFYFANSERKMDADNRVKRLQDILRAHAYTDDSQIFHTCYTRRFAMKGEEPNCIVGVFNSDDHRLNQFWSGVNTVYNYIEGTNNR